MSSLDAIHRLDQFLQLPWSALDPERVGRDWSIGRGGYGLGNETWTLSVIRKDGSADIWELPPALGAVFGMLREAEGRKIREDIRKALGV